MKPQFYCICIKGTDLLFNGSKEAVTYCDNHDFRSYNPFKWLYTRRSDAEKAVERVEKCYHRSPPLEIREGLIGNAV